MTHNDGIKRLSLITLMSVIVAFTFAIALWYFHYHKVTYAVKPFATIQKSLPRPCRHWLTGGGHFNVIQTVHFILIYPVHLKVRWAVQLN